MLWIIFFLSHDSFSFMQCCKQTFLLKIRSLNYCYYLYFYIYHIVVWWPCFFTVIFFIFHQSLMRISPVKMIKVICNESVISPDIATGKSFQKLLNIQKFKTFSKNSKQIFINKSSYGWRFDISISIVTCWYHSFIHFADSFVISPVHLG